MGLTNAQRQAKFRAKRDATLSQVSDRSMFIQIGACANSIYELGQDTCYLDIVPTIMDLLGRSEIGKISIKKDKIIFALSENPPIYRDEGGYWLYEGGNEEGEELEVEEWEKVSILSYLNDVLKRAAEIEIKADKVGAEFALAYQVFLGFIAFPAIAAARMSDMMGSMPRTTRAIEAMLEE